MLCLTVKWWSKHLTSHFSLFQAQISEQTILTDDSQTIKVSYYIFHSPDIFCGTNSLCIIIIEGVHCISVLRWPARPIQPHSPLHKWLWLLQDVISWIRHYQDWNNIELYHIHWQIIWNGINPDPYSWSSVIFVHNNCLEWAQAGEQSSFYLYSGSIWWCS